MSRRFNYFMPTPWSNPARKANVIEKNTNEFPNSDKTTTIVKNNQPESAQETEEQSSKDSEDSEIEEITF